MTARLLVVRAAGVLLGTTLVALVLDMPTWVWLASMPVALVVLYLPGWVRRLARRRQRTDRPDRWREREARNG